MTCCQQFDKLLDLELARHAQPYQLSNGTIITEIDNEYFFVFGEHRHGTLDAEKAATSSRANSGTWKRKSRTEWHEALP